MAARIPLLLVTAAFLAVVPSAWAARTVYFTDPETEEIAQFSVGQDGTLAGLDPHGVPADHARRLAMTPGGQDLYATSKRGVLQYDVAPTGVLSPKDPARVATGGWLHSIALRPDGTSAYVTDGRYGKVRQFDIGPDGALTPKDPAYVKAGPGARGVAVSPAGDTAYVLVAGGIVVYDVGSDGSLARRADRIDVPSFLLEDLALTPDGDHLYATSRDGRIFQFEVANDGTPEAGTPAAVTVGDWVRPFGIAIAPDGAAVYVSAGRTWGSSGPGRVLAYAVGGAGGLSPASDLKLASSGAKIGYLSASPDGRRLFVARGDGHVFDLGPGGAMMPAAFPGVDLKAALGVVVSPNQAPIASFVSATGPAGSPTTFDASGAADTDGTIVRYDWDFGDGTTLADGGPSPTHIYVTPGTFTVTLVVTDNEGASTTTIFTGGTVLGNGAPVAQASRQVEIAAPSPAALPPAAVPAQEPQPNRGETLVADPVAGIVRVRVRGTRRFVRLEQIEELPLGSTLDSRRGRVEVATERRRRGRVQQGVFSDGLFSVRQRARDRFVTELVLRGSLKSCPRGSATAARRSRRLWGRSSGRFRTRGRHSAGAVRGTRWLTVDRCDGTLTVVREGTVAVRDFGRKRTILVEAGERYLARKR